MSDKTPHFISVDELRIGHFVHLDVGWMGHPFALNSFRITTASQIETIRGLGLDRVRYSPEQSVLEATETQRKIDESARASSTTDPETERRRAALSEQRQRLQRCENAYNSSLREFRGALEMVHAKPEEARQRAEGVITEMVGAMGSGDEETIVRLLSEKSGERGSMHAINVAIIALLLGKALECDAEQLREIGIGGLLHDIGKIELPDRLRWADANLSGAEVALYREHVTKGVQLGRRMTLSPNVLLVLAQHHEMNNGRGFPQRLAREQIAFAARVVGLVNVYDNLCNPSNPSLAVTPHEALSLIYAQQKNCFDTKVLASFIRLMGVYPPGSVIELSTGHYAMVVSVNSSRPLRPQIVVHDARIPASEALIVDLEEHPDLGIRRSLKPQQLPKASFDYLSPRRRLCYFFERAREVEAA